MQFLVTGAAGMLGRRLVAEMLAAGSVDGAPRRIDRVRAADIGPLPQPVDPRAVAPGAAATTVTLPGLCRMIAARAGIRRAPDAGGEALVALSPDGPTTPRAEAPGLGRDAGTDALRCRRVTGTAAAAA